MDVKIVKKKTTYQPVVSAPQAVGKKSVTDVPTVTEDTLRADIENHLAPMLKQYRERLRPYTRPKIVRDVIWGFNTYDPQAVYQFLN
jgi:hypothetical protein